MGDAGLSAETFVLNFYIKNFLLLLHIMEVVDQVIPNGVQHFLRLSIYQIAKHGDLNSERKYYDNMMNYLKKMISFIHDGELEITFIDMETGTLHLSI